MPFAPAAFLPSYLHRRTQPTRQQAYAQHPADKKPADQTPLYLPVAVDLTENSQPLPCCDGQLIRPCGRQIVDHVNLFETRLELLGPICAETLFYGLGGLEGRAHQLLPAKVEVALQALNGTEKNS